RDMNPAVYEALSEAGRLALGPDARGPFDRLASGYVPGEGAVVFLLKRLADARRDGDSIRAILRGVEAVHDQEAPAGLAESLRRCLDHVGLPPALAMTDAAGLPDEDAAMVQAVQDSYASNRRDGPLYLGSVVGQIGHAGGASGGVSLLSALTALEEGTSPPTFGLVEPSAALARNLVVVRALTRGEPLDFQVSKNQRTGLVISLDKGIAYGTLIESHGGRPGCGHEAISSGIAFTHKPIHIT
ncbi:MAG TPA: beta-ketoacyl synthase N-terminal-like domain-containing protein, partial [Thermoguttaceae bacterium]|nr:beta-ketoacyl synthase N-terminal-like domain-containing protein [Thermoguttaceae bacterium]